MGRQHLAERVELRTWVKYLPRLVSFSAVPWTLDLCIFIPAEVKDLPSWSRDQQKEPEWFLSVVIALLQP